MVAILIRCIDMSRQLLSSKPGEASLPPQPATKQDEDDDIQDIPSSSWSPIPSQPDDSVTIPSTTPLVGTMSDKTASQSNQKQPGDVPTPTDGEKNQQQQKLYDSSSSGYHLHHHHEEEHRIEGESRIDDPSNRYQYHPINHRYYQSRNQYNYHSGASYYNTPPDPDNRTSATAMSSGQHYHHHSPYPGYYTTQDYGNYSQYLHDNRYLNYESTGSLGQDSAAAPSHPGPTRQYAHYYPHHCNHETEISPYYHNSFPAVSSTVATTSTTAKDDSQGRKSLDLSSSPDGDQKPSARSEKQADTRERKGASKRRRDEDISTSHHPDPQQQGQDFEPIPLNKISAIPILSTSFSSSVCIVSSSALGGGGGSGDGGAPHSHSASSYASPRAIAVGGSRSRGSSAHVAPPMPHATTFTPSTRKQPRILQPTSSGSNDTTSSTPSWEKRFTELVGFKRAHGHCEVPQNYSENPSLGTWVNKQRMEQKNRLDGKTSSLTDSRFERLQAVGFRWAKRKGQASWDEKLNELKFYKAKFGNCHVPTKYKGNTALGRWVSTQRAEYKKYSEGVAKTSMNADKIRRLEEIGFAWFMAL